MPTFGLPAAPRAASARPGTVNGLATLGGPNTLDRLDDRDHRDAHVKPHVLAAHLAAAEALWRPHVRFAEPRAYTRLLVRPGWEAWLLTWLPGQSTGLHDHGGSAGAIAVLEGALDETVLAQAPSGLVPRMTRYRSGQVRPFGPRHVHDVEASGVPSISLHVYAPALTRMTRYALDDGRLVELVSERAGADW